jgi:outer membrane protein assembly factor BamB
VFLGFLLVLLGVVSQTIPAVEWPQFRGGPQRSGVVAESKILADLSTGAALVEAWRSEELPHGYGHQNACVVGQGSPVVAEGRVYLYVNWPDPDSVTVQNSSRIPSRAWDTVLCLDMASGATVWKTKMPGRSWRWGCSTTLAVGAGKVVGMGSLGEAFCLDAGTGKEVWRWSDPKKSRPEKESYTDIICSTQSSALISENRAIFVDPAGQLIVCTLPDGLVQWTANTNIKTLWSSPSLWRQSDTQTLLVGGTAFDCITGKQVWSLPKSGWSTPALEGDICAMMGSGKGLFISRLSKEGSVTVADLPLDNGAGNAAIAKGRIYACGQRGGTKKPDGGNEPSLGVMLCVDGTTGQVLWETLDPTMQMGGGKWSFTSVVVGGQTVAALVDRKLWLFDARDGKRLRDAITVENLKGGTSLALTDEQIITRGTKAVVCYQAGVKP